MIHFLTIGIIQSCMIFVIYDSYDYPLFGYLRLYYPVFLLKIADILP